MGTVFDGLRQDVKVTLRSLGRSPGFTAVVVATVALAMAANAAVFALVDAYFLKPLPYDDPDELVVLWETGRDGREPTTVAPGTYRDWQRQLESLEAVGASNLTWPTISGDDGPAERVLGALTTPELMALVGAEPMLGRGIGPDDAREGAEPVVVLSHGLWSRRYGGDPGVVGRDIRISGAPTTVVGVMGPDFQHPSTFNERSRTPVLWLPMPDQGDSREFRYLHVVGRRAPGSSVETVRAEAAALVSRLAGTYPDAYRGRGAVVRPLDDEVFGPVRPAVAMLLGAAGLVLLIACANLANLMLARGRRRYRELAVRAALGSGRLRILRQLSVESLLLGLGGGLAGAAAVLALGGPVSAAAGRYFLAAGDVSVDLRVLGFTLAGALGASLLFGVLPALRLSRPDLQSVLGQRGSGGGSAGARRALVVTEVALTVVLLVTGGLLVRSLLALVRVPVGFELENRLVLEVLPPADAYPDAPAVLGYYGELNRRVEALPGVERATLMSDLPFTGENRGTGFRIPGRPLPGDQERYTEYHAVGPGYFEVMGIPLLEGRTFQRSDAADAPAVAVVSEALVRRDFGGESPVGRTLTFEEGGETVGREVVGVVADALDDGLDTAPEPRLYQPFPQAPNRGMAMIVRTGVPPGSVAPAVRGTAAELDPGVVVSDFRTLEEHVLLTADRPRGAAMLVAGFAGLALLIAAVGIYGVLAYTVAERRREIGIRAALGAARERLVAMVLGESLRLAAAGAAVGAVLSLAASRLVSGLLFGVTPLDPVSFLGAVLLVSGVAALAAWVPARKAAGIPPAEAMRVE